MNITIDGHSYTVTTEEQLVLLLSSISGYRRARQVGEDAVTQWSSAVDRSPAFLCDPQGRYVNPGATTHVRRLDIETRFESSALQVATKRSLGKRIGGIPC